MRRHTAAEFKTLIAGFVTPVSYGWFMKQEHVAELESIRRRVERLRRALVESGDWRQSWHMLDLSHMMEKTINDWRQKAA